MTATLRANAARETRLAALRREILELERPGQEPGLGAPGLAPADLDRLVVHVTAALANGQVGASPGGGHGSGGDKNPKMPQPQKFSGEDHQDLDDALFAFETYCNWNKLPQDKWAVYCANLLTGAAAKQYTTYAQTLTGPPTWEQFKQTLQVFARPDKRLAAQQSLFSLTQTKSVREYVQQFNLLRARSGNHTAETDLTLLFWKGLKDPGSVAINPATNAFWTSLDALMQHVLQRELSRTVTAPVPVAKPNGQPRKFGWSVRPKLHAVSLQGNGGRGGGYNGGRGNGGVAKTRNRGGNNNAGRGGRGNGHDGRGNGYGAKRGGGGGGEAGPNRCRKCKALGLNYGASYYHKPEECPHSEEFNRVFNGGAGPSGTGPAK